MTKLNNNDDEVVLMEKEGKKKSITTDEVVKTKLKKYVSVESSRNNEKSKTKDRRTDEEVMMKTKTKDRDGIMNCDQSSDSNQTIVHSNIKKKNMTKTNSTQCKKERTLFGNLIHIRQDVDFHISINVGLSYSQIENTEYNLLSKFILKPKTSKEFITTCRSIVMNLILSTPDS